MKNLLIVLVLILTINCKNNKTVKVTAKKETTNLPFLGNWTRSFEMGKGVTANVTYTIYNDSIHYEMLGPMTLKYTLMKDEFLQKDNRWIGKRDGKPYVIFMKNISKNAITLLKMKVKSKEDAINMTFPSDTARSKFSSWNTFTKK